jgi:hypothetical protein
VNLVFTQHEGFIVCHNSDKLESKKGPEFGELYWKKERQERMG